MFVPEFIKDVILKLNNNGYEAYLVGGAVRDAIMEYPVSDYDVTTNASLDDLRSVFSDEKVVGYSSGKTLLIIKGKEEVEITPFKGDSLIDDLSHRDFTMNAIAYDLNEFIDPFDGIGDIKRRIIKTPINPNETIEYEHTRLIRAIKFEARYDMKIDSQLKKAMSNNAKLLLDINKERIREDLNKILLSVKPSIYFNEHKEIFFTLFPALKDCYKFEQKSRWHHLDVFDHIMAVVDTVKQDLILRLAALYHDIKKPECFSIDERGGHFYNHFVLSAEYAKQSMKEFRYSSDEIDRVYNLVLYHDRPLEDNDKSVLKLINKFGLRDLDLYFAIKRADIISQNPQLIDRIYDMDNIASRCRRIVSNREYINRNTLNIKGNDIIALGFKPIHVKAILEGLVKMVIDNKVNNNYDDLLNQARKLYNINDNE